MEENSWSQESVDDFNYAWHQESWRLSCLKKWSHVERWEKVYAPVIGTSSSRTKRVSFNPERSVKIFFLDGAFPRSPSGESSYLQRDLDRVPITWADYSPADLERVCANEQEMIDWTIKDIASENPVFSQTTFDGPVCPVLHISDNNCVAEDTDCASDSSEATMEESGDGSDDSWDSRPSSPSSPISIETTCYMGSKNPEETFTPVRDWSADFDEEEDAAAMDLMLAKLTGAGLVQNQGALVEEPRAVVDWADEAFEEEEEEDAQAMARILAHVIASNEADAVARRANQNALVQNQVEEIESLEAEGYSGKFDRSDDQSLEDDEAAMDMILMKLVAPVEREMVVEVSDLAGMPGASWSRSLARQKANKKRSAPKSRRVRGGRRRRAPCQTRK